MIRPEPTRVAVLFGGDSPEREVSLSSGGALCPALEGAGFLVEPLEADSPRRMLEMAGRSGADVFFIALHGSWGEDGRIQAALELMGKVYTGSGATACALAMDKRASKALFSADGVPTPRAVCLFPGDRVSGAAEMKAADALKRWGRIVIKPSGCGSTVGVTIVSSKAEVEEALSLAFSFDGSVLVEEYIPGREITVTVWEEGGKTCSLPVIQIEPRQGFYDYQAKYTPGRTEYLCPAPLTPTELERVEAAAVAAHGSLGCRVFSRVDMRLTGEGHPYVLEVNTVPGMTATSLVPKSAAAAGWGFDELARRIVRSSMELRSAGTGLLTRR
ncbi:MAG TPA: D-alanine--D-alanine ligase [Synergistales bacterium]|nr:D-alanine--D-alanine ligase [Synergistales bacterium]